MQKRNYWSALKCGVAAFCVAAVAFACTKDENPKAFKESDKIAFSVALDNGVVAKSSDGANSHFLCSFGEDSVYLSVCELDNSVQWALGADTAAVETKGAPIEDPSGSGENRLAEFWVSAKLDDGNIYFADERVDVASGSSGRYWPKEENLNFFAYAPYGAKQNVTSPSFVKNDDAWTGSFSYTMPKDDTDGNDAEILPDYIYTIASGKSKTDGVAVPLTFHHAFSAISFTAGVMPEGVVIKYIALKYIYSSGSCSFVEDATKGIEFTWSSQEVQTTFKQDFSVLVNGSADKGIALNTKEQTFMVVPQTLPDNAEFEVCFSLNGVEKTLCKAIKDVTDEWEADKKYVYNISLPDEVSIEIEDSVEGAVKRDVEITNTGIATSYIRAAVIGYWVVGNYVVAAWNETDGNFVYDAQWDNYWIKHSDGFYYYKYSLEPGKSPEVPLFETYTLVNQTSYEQAKLQLNIMVQAVIASSKDSGVWPWPVELKNQLN